MAARDSTASTTTTSSATARTPDSTEALASEGARLRSSGLFARSDRLIGLFDFLLARSCAGQSPKEIEIAWEVLGLRDADATDTAAVRVHMHRLRRKLDDHYGDTPGPRLHLPRGQYRLFYGTQPTAGIEPAPEPDMPAIPDHPAAPRTPARTNSTAWLLGLVLIAVINIAGWVAWLSLPAMHPTPGAAGLAFWHILETNGHQTSLVVGDYYMFGQGPTQAGITHIVRDFSINSRDDLFLHLMDHPEQRQDYVDLNMHYVPVGVVNAVCEITQMARQTGPGHAVWSEMAASSLTPTALRATNIVYVGFVNDLGVLAKLIAQAGGVVISPSDNALQDPVTGRRYQAPWQQPAGLTEPRRDYGYIASLPGLNGGRILVIAGTRDPAVLQAAEATMDKALSKRLAGLTNDAAGFEALFEVTTLGDTDLHSNLLFARPLNRDPRKTTSR